MTKRVWVLVAFVLGVVTGVWIERSVEQDASPPQAQVQLDEPIVYETVVAHTTTRVWVNAGMKAREGSFLANHGYCRAEDMYPAPVDYPGRRYRCVHVDELSR